MEWSSFSWAGTHVLKASEGKKEVETVIFERLLPR